MPALDNFLHERFCQALHARLWTGEKQSLARVAAYRETIYRGGDPNDNALKPNTRRLCRHPEVKARLVELNGEAATRANLDAGWALLKLKKLVDTVEGATLEHYLGPVNDKGRRYFDLSKVTPEQMAILSELSIDDTTTVVPKENGPDEIHHSRKMKLRIPPKTDITAPIALMARIGGWEAPKKLAATTKDGEDLSFADVVAEAMALVEAKRAAAKPTAGAAA